MDLTLVPGFSGSGRVPSKISECAEGSSLIIFSNKNFDMAERDCGDEGWDMMVEHRAVLDQEEIDRRSLIIDLHNIRVTDNMSRDITFRINSS